MSRIGSLVRTARQAGGLSRAGLATASGVPHATIEAVERGIVSNPGVRTVARLATTLDIDPAAVLRAALED